MKGYPSFKQPQPEWYVSQSNNKTTHMLMVCLRQSFAGYRMVIFGKVYIGFTNISIHHSLQ